MNNAKLYSDFSNMQQNESNEIASEFLSSLNRSCDSFLDIGCGPGTTLFNNILPHLSEKPRKVVGVDASENMIWLAKEKYPNGLFFEFDIQHDLSEGSEWLDVEGFELVTSFFCHHWIRNERSVLSINQSFNHKTELSILQQSILKYLRFDEERRCFSDGLPCSCLLLRRR